LHAGDGQWSYTAVWGAHATVQVTKDGDGCNPMTPVACGLAAKLQRGRGFRLVRLGYSAVDAATHIRPHWGPTNSQIKAHLGLVVPTGPEGQDCTTLRVAGVERPWKPGHAIVFDDSFLHEVWNNCSTQRVVLQAVFAHPDLYPGRDERKTEL
jgi:aspartate beta-hydroxylase